VIGQAWVVNINARWSAVIASDDDVEDAAQSVRRLIDMLCGTIRRQQVIDTYSEYVVRPVKPYVEVTRDEKR